jgi:hypothetical protein
VADVGRRRPVLLVDADASGADPFNAEQALRY